MSLLTTSTVGPLAGGDPASYAGLAALLAETIIARISAVARQLPEAHGPTVLGVLAVALLGLARWRRSRPPVALLVVFGAGLAIVVLGLEAAGIAVLVTVPAGLPMPSLRGIDPPAATALLPGAATIALLAYLEGISVARALAVRMHQPVDATQKLFASSGANLAAGPFQAFPVSGGFSRTAVNFDARARTPPAGLVTAAVVALAVAVAAPALAVLPTVVPAAVVVVAVVGLSTWSTREAPGGSTTGTEPRGCSRRWSRWSSASSRASSPASSSASRCSSCAPVGRTSLSSGGCGVRTSTANRDRYDTVGDPRVAIVCVDGPLFYANSRHVETWIEGLLAGRPDTDAMIADMSAVGAIDAAGVHAVAALDRALASPSVQLRPATVRGPVHDALQRAGVAATLAGRIDPDVPTALHALDRSGPLVERTLDEPTMPDRCGEQRGRRHEQQGAQRG